MRSALPFQIMAAGYNTSNKRKIDARCSDDAV
jgi:hypothetical protein